MLFGGFTRGYRNQRLIPPRGDAAVWIAAGFLVNARRNTRPNPTLSKIETGAYAGAPTTLEAIRRTLEYAGVEFTNGEAPGVKLRKR